MPRIMLMFALLLVLVAGCGPDKPMRTTDPNLSLAHVERAKFFWGHGEVNKTIQELEWAIQADPYNYDAAYNLGLIYLDQGQRVSARRVWENALTYMEDGDGKQMENYDNARRAADIQAALAELEKGDRQLANPEAILARQGQRSYDASATAGTAGGGGGVSGTVIGSDNAYAAGTGAGYGAGSGSGAPGQTGSAQTGSVQTGQQPKPYVPSAQDGKPTPRTQSGARSGSGSSGGGRASDCPPCAPQSSGKYAIQVSSNKQQKNAQQDMNRLIAKGYHATVAANQIGGNTWYVVWVGCCTSQDKAKDLAGKLIKQGLVPRDARVAIPK